MKKTFSIFNFQALLAFHTIWPTFNMEKPFQFSTSNHCLHFTQFDLHLTWWYSNTTTTTTPNSQWNNASNPLFSTHLERGGLLLWKKGMHFKKTLVLISSKTLSLFYKYNNLGLGYSYSFQKMQFQGLDSCLIFLISWTFGLDTSRPNLEP